MRDNSAMKIMSDGTPAGTRVYEDDGSPVDCRGVEIVITPDEMQVLIQPLVVELDIVGEAEWRLNEVPTEAMIKELEKRAHIPMLLSHTATAELAGELKRRGLLVTRPKPKPKLRPKYDDDEPPF